METVGIEINASNSISYSARLCWKRILPPKTQIDVNNKQNANEASQEKREKKDEENKDKEITIPQETDASFRKHCRTENPMLPNL